MGSLSLLSFVATVLLAFEETAAWQLPQVSSRSPLGSLTRRSTTAPQEDTILGEAGDEWSTFSWKKKWYPMAFSDVTDKCVPSRLELMGEPMVLW